jgi:hypothetical protein
MYHQWDLYDRTPWAGRLQQGVPSHPVILCALSAVKINCAVAEICGGVKRKGLGANVSARYLSLALSQASLLGNPQADPLMIIIQGLN